VYTPSAKGTLGPLGHLWADCRWLMYIHELCTRESWHCGHSKKKRHWD